MKLSVMTIEKAFLSSLEVEEVNIPGVHGGIGVLKEHAPLITLLGTGVLEYRIKGESLNHKMVLSGGYAQVRGEDIIILADEVGIKEQLNKNEIAEQLGDVSDQLKNLNSSPSQTSALQKKEKKYQAYLSLFK